MSANVTPSVWFGGGYGSNNVNHQIGFNTRNNGVPTLAQLSDAQADITTGDVRQILFAIAELAYQSWLTQLAGGNRPVEMSLQRSVSTDSSGNFTLQYQQQFTLAQSGL